MATLRVGDPLDKNTDVGAINSRAQLEKIEELVAAGSAEGAEIYQPPCRLPEKGYWFAPTVFTNVAQSYRIAQEEIFGPVLSVLTFRTPEEAVEKANNTPYGLSAGVWTEKGSRILWMAERLRAGVVWANTFNRFDPTSPFGGYKESGFGREGGRHGLEPYLAFDERWLRSGAATAADEERSRRSTGRRGRRSRARAAPDEAAVLRRADGAADVLVAVVDGGVAGYVRSHRASRFRLERARPHAQRRRGRPGAAGRGIGRALIDAAVAEARARGARRLTCACSRRTSARGGSTSRPGSSSRACCAASSSSTGATSTTS